MDKKLAKKLNNWMTKIGNKDIAAAHLIQAGCSTRLAAQLVAGTYDHRLRRMTVMAIEQVIKHV